MGEKTKRLPALLKAADIAAMPVHTHQHSINRNAVRISRSLGDATGLKSMGIHLVTVPPGRDSTEYHVHHQDEEWLYILSGRGIAEIGDEKHEIGAGDFMGLAAGGEPHSMSNPFDEDLVYLMGGNRWPFDVADYPRKRKRRYRVDGVNTAVEWDSLTPPPDAKK